MDILDLEETGGIFEARVTRITKDTTADYVKKSRPRDQDELRSSQLVVLSLGIAWKGFTRWREKNVCWQTDVLVQTLPGPAQQRCHDDEPQEWGQPHEEAGTH